MLAFSWSFRKDEDNFIDSENSIEDCIKSAQEMQMGVQEPAQVIYIGENVQHVPVVDADAFIEGLKEEAWNQCGEVADDWLNSVTPVEQEVLQRKLQAVLDEWLAEVEESPPFYSVVNIKPYSLQ